MILRRSLMKSSAKLMQILHSTGAVIRVTAGCSELGVSTCGTASAWATTSVMKNKACLWK